MALDEFNEKTGKTDAVKLGKYITFNMAAFKKQNCEISSNWKAEKYFLAGAATTILRIATAK